MKVIKMLEPWAVTHQQTWNSEALQTYGEMVAVRQRWQHHDFKQGLVERCTSCNDGQTQDVQDRMSRVYKGQAGSSLCQSCYGTGFNGGYKPVVYVVWALFSQNSDAPTLAQDSRGAADKLVPQFQVGWDPKVYNGDLIVRALEWSDDDDYPQVLEEDSRYIVQDVDRTILKTGPRGQERHQQSVIVSQMASCAKAQPDHIEYEIPLT